MKVKNLTKQNKQPKKCERLAEQKKIGCDNG